MTFDKFTESVIRWASERGIFDHADPMSQWGKTLEEVQELRLALLEGDHDGTIDAIGDIIVTLVIQAHMHGMDAMACCEAAWDEIKDRRGSMVDGVFVKEEKDNG